MEQREIGEDLNASISSVLAVKKNLTPTNIRRGGSAIQKQISTLQKKELWKKRLINFLGLTRSISECQLYSTEPDRYAQWGRVCHAGSLRGRRLLSYGGRTGDSMEAINIPDELLLCGQDPGCLHTAT